MKNFGFGVDQPIDGVGSAGGPCIRGRSEFPDFTVNKYVDRASPKLFEIACIGKVIDVIALNLVSNKKNDKDEINVTIANVTYDRELSTTIDLNGIDNYSLKKSEIITAEEMNSYNDFEKEEEVNISEFKGIKKEGNSIKVNIPSKSVILISLK